MLATLGRVKVISLGSKRVMRVVVVVLVVLGISIGGEIVRLVQSLIGAALVGGVHLVHCSGALLGSVDQAVGRVPCLCELGGSWLDG